MSKSPECTIHVEQNIYQPFKCALTFHQLYHRESKIHRDYPFRRRVCSAKYYLGNNVINTVIDFK